MADQLSMGSLQVIMKGGTVEDPVMQILGIKKMGSGPTSNRYRILISDGKYLNSFAMLASQVNEKIESGELTENTIVRITRFITSMVNNTGRGDSKRVMVILDCDVVEPGQVVGEKIGNPIPYEEAPDDGSDTTAMTRPDNQAQPQQQNQYRQTVGVVGSPVKATHPISSLNPYQNRWTIKARCTSKTPVKTWSNARSEGKLFSMDLLDESGEIRCTAFKEAVDKYYEMVEVGKVYLISNCQIKTANKQFTRISHDYEMTVNTNSTIQPCSDDESSVPTVTYNFTPIEKIAALEDGALIDIIGICKSVSEAQEIVSKASGKQFIKRDIFLVDDTSTSVVLTLWNEQATDFDGSANPVVVVKGARMKEFNGGKTLSVQSMSTLLTNPDLPQGHRLRGWYENEGVNMEFSSVSARSGGGAGDMGGGDSNWITFGQIRVRQLGCGDKPDYVIVKATILTTFHENAIYMSCPNDDCKKKLFDLQNGMFRCEKCNREYDEAKFRLLTRFNIGDHSSNQFVTAFQEQSEMILGATADELGNMEKSNPPKYQSIFDAACFKQFVFKLRIKMENYNDTNQIKASVVAVQKPVNYKKYNAHLISEIQRLHGMSKPT